ncbi:MAG: YceI family protein [Bacteroidota bacterium]
MKSFALTIVLLIVPLLTRSQDSLWFTRSGHIYFISHTDIIDIDANHYQVGSFFNIKTGELAFTLLMKSFQFTLPLAEEHFNENYVESEKYPKSTFKGKIIGYDPAMLSSDAEFPVEVEGNLTIHGVTAKVKEKGIIRKNGDEIRATSRFKILVDTYRIKVPNIVADRVAPVIPIDVEMVYKVYQKKEGK